MANTKSAAKRARQTTRRTATNRRALTAVKTQLKGLRETLKGLRETLKGGDKAKAKAAAATFVSTIDKAAKAGRVHRNAANRQKSKANKALAKLA